jgi:YD repeat-containing protein
MTHRSEILYERAKAGMTLDVRNYDAEGYLVVSKKTGFARQVVRYDAQGRLLSLECFDEKKKPKNHVYGMFSKVSVEYDADGKAKLILMQGIGDKGEVESIKMFIVGDKVECSLLDGKNAVKDTGVRKLDDIPKEFLKLGQIRYSVDSNRWPTQIVVPSE